MISELAVIKEELRFLREIFLEESKGLRASMIALASSNPPGPVGQPPKHPAKVSAWDAIGTPDVVAGEDEEPVMAVDPLAAALIDEAATNRLRVALLIDFDASFFDGEGFTVSPPLLSSRPCVFFDPVAAAWRGKRVRVLYILEEQW